MKNVCCIGSSHIGSLKWGWSAIAPRWSGMNMTFFGAPDLRPDEESLKHLTLQGRRIVPTDEAVRKYYQLTSGGLDAIELDAYDGFILQGGIGLIKPLDLYTFFRTDEQTHADTHALVSAECLVESFAELFRSTFAYRLSTAMHHLTRKPVFLVTEPRPSQGLLTSEGSGVEKWDFYIKLISQLHSNGDHVPLARYYRAALQAIRQKGVELVDGPEELIVDELFTPHAFCKESLWLQNNRYEPSPRDDFFHMNGVHGVGVLEEILMRAGARPDA